MPLSIPRKTMTTPSLNSPAIRPPKLAIHGILLLDKAQDITSNGALQQAKRLYAARKAGHCGSLDPLATGLLPICFGEATKYSQYLIDADKTYEVTALLGITTTTGDSEGDILQQCAIAANVTDNLPTIIPHFTGELLQIPPMYSALKHQGRALYDYARAGITIPREARRIMIYRLELLEINLPLLRFRVHCSKGTYIRVLMEDIGQALGCGAHVVALRRVSISGLPSDCLITQEQLIALPTTDRLTHLQPIDLAVQRLPRVLLTAPQTQKLINGVSVSLNGETIPPGDVSVYRDCGQFMGVATVSGSQLIPKRLLSVMPGTGHTGANILLK